VLFIMMRCEIPNNRLVPATITDRRLLNWGPHGHQQNSRAFRAERDRDCKAILALESLGEAARPPPQWMRRWRNQGKPNPRSKLIDPGSRKTDRQQQPDSNIIADQGQKCRILE
jgi:hypothetical protein